LRAFNCIFGKVGRVASQNTLIELLKAKCLLSMYYGLEACPINKSQIRSLDLCDQQFIYKKYSQLNRMMLPTSVCYFLIAQSLTYYIKERLSF